MPTNVPRPFKSHVCLFHVDPAHARDNVLFGKPFDPERFQMALHVTCMRADVDTMASGVDTMIGAHSVCVLSTLCRCNTSRPPCVHAIILSARARCRGAQATAG